MDQKKFKKIICELACKCGFKSEFGGWFKASEESILVLNLQKSNFSNLFYLNIKIFMQGIRGNTYVISKELSMKEPGNIFRRQPKEYDVTFDLGSTLSDEQRIDNLESLFKSFIAPFSEKCMSKRGINELWKDGQICLLPAAENYLSC